MRLREYLDTLERGGIKDFAEAVGITDIYLSQLAARLNGKEPSPELCVRIEGESCGMVTRRDLLPDRWHLIWPELAVTRESREQTILDIAVKECGGISKLARRLGVAPAVVGNWIWRKNVPKGWEIALNLMFGAKDKSTEAVV